MISVFWVPIALWSLCFISPDYSERISMVKNRNPILGRWKCYLGIIQLSHKICVRIAQSLDN
jgi:hypothetical protein